MDLNLDETREWLEIVYGDTPGYLHICSVGDWKGMAFSHEDPHQIDKALAYIQGIHARGAEGIYLRATTLRQAPHEGSRGGDDLSFYLPGLWADIDIAGPGHKTKGTLPPSTAEAMKIVRASGLPEPSHWIHSGGGIYPWWILDSPHEIEDVEFARSLSNGWQQALLRGALKLGYSYGTGVGDLSRVLRIPGTVNRKAGLERPCSGDGPFAWSGERFQIQDLVDALAATIPAPQPTPVVTEWTKSGPQRTGESPGDEFNRTASWRDILMPHGWDWIRKQGDTWYLRRPGKTQGGHSATLRDSTDKLWVFSEEAHPLEAFRLYDKFGAFAALEHHGDFREAARFLGSKGYGARPTVGVAAPVQTPSAPKDVVPVPMPPTPPHTPPMAPAAGSLTRNRLVANEDRWFVLQNLTKELVARWDTDRLFNFGDVLCERKGFTMRPVTKAGLDAISVETCEIVNFRVKETVKGGRQESFVPAPVEMRILEMVMARPEEFARLDKLSQIPFVRPDGTICATPGYDPHTRTFLELDPLLAGINVPEAPTKEAVAWARKMLLEDLLGDFPLHTEADKANAVATLLTPFVRDLIPTSPLAVIDAKEAGSGKNLMADIIAILTTGKSAQTLPYTVDDAEQRKVITSAFRSGNAMLLFDEAHEIEGASFARALTSHSYQDRILGGSNMAEFPNNRTWISLGNQVQIKGDMGRRVYRVRLEYQGARPESRDASQFRHPDLRQWAIDNRRDLVTACLILVRAWFALDRPAAKLPFRMGSFERWQETLAGILWVAGIEGFLDNVPQWRSESDFDRQHLVGHLEWLEGQFGGKEFTSAQVTEALKRDRTAEHPPDLEDPFVEGFSRKLGQAYARFKDRILDGLQLVKLSSSGHNNVIKWKIRKIVEEVDDHSTE
jgi:hypothetical protein